MSFNLLLGDGEQRYRQHRDRIDLPVYFSVDGESEFYRPEEILSRILSQIAATKLYRDDDLTGFLEGGT